MFQIIKSFLCSLISSYILFYGVENISGNKFKNTKKLFICMILYSLYLSFSFDFLVNYMNVIRIFLNYIVLIAMIKFITKDENNKVILYSFLSLLIMFISEFICTILLVYVLKIELKLLKTTFFGSFTTNIMIAVIMFLLLNLKKTRKTINLMFNEIYIKKNKNMLLLSIITIFSFIILVYSLYFSFPTTYNLLINFVLVISFSFLAINSFYKMNQNDKLMNDYEVVINELGDYEKMLNEKRKLLHNKENDLISIRGLIKGKNKEALDYIDEALNENYTEDVDILEKVKYIPSGGLQGLIHKKVLKIKENGLNFILKIDRNISLNSKNAIKNNKVVCTIIGILLDNAYEAALKSSEKIINIEVFCNKKELVFKIENSYNGLSNMKNIDEQGFSTKGKNRGFGLGFVKELIDENSWIVNERQINGNIFTQIIKIKKSH